MSKKIKSIKVKIIMFLVPMLLIAFMALSSFGYKFASNSLKESNLNVMSEVTKTAAARAEDQIQSEIKNLEVLASNPIISNENLPIEDKREILKSALSAVKQLNISLSDQNGNSIDTNGNKKNIRTSQSFMKSIKGENSITNPYVDPDTKKKVISYSVPVKNSSGTIIGIISSVKDCKDFSNLNNEISFLKTGSSLIVDSNGNFIVAEDESLVSENKNITTITSDKGSLSELNNIGKSMTLGSKSGIGKYMYEGKAKYITYSAIGKTGLSIGITVDEKDLLSALNSLAVVDAVVTIIMILVISAIIIGFTIKVINRLVIAKVYVDDIANGDFYSEIDQKYLKAEDEISTICASVDQAKRSVGNMIRSVKENANVVRTGSLSLNEISEQLAVLTEEISASIGEIAISTNKESCEFEDISNKLSAFGEDINMVKDNIHLISDDIFVINNKSLDGAKDIEQLNDGIKSVNSSFENFSINIEYIQGSMKNVHEITNIINGISEQINILSFNAAIEAASAGDAGKGFNVIALEVKKLSDKSRESAQNINKIIKKLMDIIKNIVEESNNMDIELKKQKDMVYNASSSFTEIASLVNEITPKVSNTNSLFKNITDNKDLIVKTISELSQEIKNTSNSLEQVTDSSVELAIFADKVNNSSNILLDKADDLIEKVKQFKIEQDDEYKSNEGQEVQEEDFRDISLKEQEINKAADSKSNLHLFEHNVARDELNSELFLIEGLDEYKDHEFDEDEELDTKDFGWNDFKITELKNYIEKKDLENQEDREEDLSRYNIS